MSPARTRRTSSASPVSTLSIPIDPVTTSQVCKVSTLSARCCDAVQGHLGIQSERAVCGNTPWTTVPMSRLNLALVTMAVLAGACYKDDTTIGPGGRKPMAQVLITDDPFPFDSVQNVWVYIVSIAASTQADTGGSADSMSWVTLAEPHRQVDRVTLHQVQQFHRPMRLGERDPRHAIGGAARIRLCGRGDTDDVHPDILHRVEREGIVGDQHLGHRLATPRSDGGVVLVAGARED